MANEFLICWNDPPLVEISFRFASEVPMVLENLSSGFNTAKFCVGLSSNTSVLTRLFAVQSFPLPDRSSPMFALSANDR